jgi:hypothetical protein
MDIAKKTIDQFQTDLFHILGGELYEIVIHGSYALGDFIPSKGDLDYTVVTAHDPTDTAIAGLFALHDRYREEKGLLLHQLEGTTYPLAVLSDPTVPFVGCYIGTGRAGWRKISTFQNSWIDLRIMEESGIRVLGNQPSFFHPTADAVQAEGLRDLAKLRRHIEKMQARDLGVLFATIHWCARNIYLRRKDRIASKSEACRWCQGEPDLVEFHEAFSIAQAQRSPYALCDAPPWMPTACMGLLNVTESDILNGGRAHKAWPKR